MLKWDWIDTLLSSTKGSIGAFQITSYCDFENRIARRFYRLALRLPPTPQIGLIYVALGYGGGSIDKRVGSGVGKIHTENKIYTVMPSHEELYVYIYIYSFGTTPETWYRFFRHPPSIARKCSSCASLLRLYRLLYTVTALRSHWIRCDRQYFLLRIR